MTDATGQLPVLTRPRKVVIVQEVVLHYRERFYELLRDRLRRAEIELVLVHSNDMTGDVWRSGVDLHWSHRVPVRRLRLGGRELVWQSCWHLLDGSDLIIVEQGSRHLLNYLLFTGQALGRRRVALWGHGRNLDVRDSSRLGEAVKAMGSRRAHWWFAYNDLSAEIVEGLGVARGRITAVQNTIDTIRLRDRVAALTEDDVHAMRRSLGLDGGRVGLYLGSLAPGKRLDYLFEASEAVHAAAPDFHLIVTGAGTEDARLRRFAAARQWVHPVGPVRGSAKAGMLRVADLVLLPAGAGLAVLDSFAAGTPMVISRAFPHGPEASYIEQGVNGVAVDDGGDPSVYGRAIVDLLADQARRTVLGARARESAERYTIENMVERFAGGIEDALAAGT
ncbi:glycosyltransferase family 4 protein [Nitriliruptor alkaliphilus]|uniref:glycosyltransferase family 4 protein n=1 Tax=Nitriliruptor alkaliphilus TaxID=427918 RepID=UPI0006977B3D|nr:glycosyltransferase family 4 protein [Nitriliruptor alkaliphilus]